MIRGISLTAILLGLSACASTDAPAPVLVTQAEPVAVGSTSTAPEGDVHVVDVPAAPKVSNVSHTAGVPNPDEVVCRRIKITGSHRVTRVCYTRAEIEQMRQAARQQLNTLDRKPDGMGASEPRRQRPSQN